MESRVGLEQFDVYQGREVDLTIADEIVRLQKDFLKSALREGMADLSDFENGSMVSEHPLYRAFAGLKLVREFVESGAPFLLKIHAVTNFYKDIHECLDIEEDWVKLFFEYLLGLLRFEVISQMSLKLAEMVDEDFKVDVVDGSMLDGVDFWASLRGPEEVLHQVYSKVIASLGSNSRDFWSRLERIIKSDAAFEEAARALMALHYLPDDKRVVSIAQVLHWQGFGGEGEIFELFPELSFLERQAIAYHNGVKTEDMNGRISWFAGVMGCLKLESIGILTRVIKRLFPDKERIRIFDIGSGDKVAAINGLKAFMPEKRIMVTAADVAGESLQSLCKMKDRPVSISNLRVERVIYQDLSGDLQAGDNRNSYDVCSAGNVLHHLMDRERGEENMGRVMRFAAETVRTGGLIYLQDVGEAAYLQFPVIPGNLVDREGCLPPNIYSRLKFADVVAPADPGYVKIPWRLSRLWGREPQSLSEDSGIYEYNFYVVVRIPERELENLDLLRSHGKFEECDAIIQDYFDINGIQREVLENVGGVL